MQKKLLNRWETKFILILLCIGFIGYILSIKGDSTPYPWLEVIGVGLLLLSILFIVFSLIILVPVQLIRFKYYKLLALFISILLLIFAVLMIILPLKFASLDPTGRWCKLRGGYFEFNRWALWNNHLCMEKKSPPQCDEFNRNCLTAF